MRDGIAAPSGARPEALQGAGGRVQGAAGGAPWLRLLALTAVLNVVRYTIVPLLEAPIVRHVFTAMAAEPEIFRTHFGTFDWVTSVVYNFVLWWVAVVAVHCMQPGLRGGWWLRCAKGWGLLWASFAAVSAVYMNHYTHERAFYLWNIADSLLVFALLGATYALLHPHLVGEKAT